MKVGVDFGGVLSVHDAEGAEHINTAINVSGGVEALDYLSKEHELFLVSFCGKSRAIETTASIKENDCSKYFEKEYYVKKKTYKKDICLMLGCNFMIDDRSEILDDVKDGCPGIVTILFGESDYEGDRHLKASDWKDVVSIIENTPHFVLDSVEPKNLNKLRYDV